MKRRNMTNIDLRLLTIVNELNKTRSVSQAAENLELSQSAVSMSLARLRKHFKDPLFVRTPDGMEPTPQMSELIELLDVPYDVHVHDYGLICPRFTTRSLF